MFRNIYIKPDGSVSITHDAEKNYHSKEFFNNPKDLLKDRKPVDMKMGNGSYFHTYEATDGTHILILQQELE